MSEYSSPLTAGQGGVMTEEAGVITGDLELRTVSTGDGVITAKIRYQGAGEWYRVRGGACKIVDDRDHAAVHSLLVGVLNRPTG
ncbi:hypothetical protein EV193_105473 [Herbihabitans rhizosphaerae]|uniref:Uncharacterized protein n=1 Tax=Herbihabitans rhizosphaerae TaxID=1872711 RepID=A0A4V2ESK7_9PSEU|nr:hypothetical protein [Herbihabitans rhizosphaerae]RZS37913.1 hypothetical protein EV193_105473 [Herbihabitans rhizosphaerae]